MIVALEDAKYKLIAMRESIEELGLALRSEETKANLKDLEAQTQSPDFWNSAEKSSKTLQVIKQGQDKVAGYEKLCARLEDAIALAEVAIEENDESFVEEVQGELDAIVAEEEHKRIEVLLSGDHAKIDRYRLEAAVEITRRQRPELLLLHPEIEESLKPKPKKRRRCKDNGKAEST